MMCANAKEQMAAAWAGELDEAAEAQLERHLAACGECSAEMSELGAMWQRLADLPAPEPSMALHVRWQAALAGLEMGRQAQPRWKFSFASLWPRRPLWQVAVAGACLAAGLVIGLLAGTQIQKDRGDAPQIAALKSEVETTREMVALSLLTQQSATERLRGVDYSQQMPTLEPRVVLALVEAVNRDPNVNVRLAAVDALSRAAGDARVRQSLAASLPQQDSPMVQAALVDYLVDSRDKSAARMLREFSSRADVDAAVRQHAALAVRRLGE